MSIESLYLTPTGSTSPETSNPSRRPAHIYDVTLRDGEQQAGVVFSVDQKLEIFQALDAAGVQVIETGMIAVSSEETEIVQRAREVEHTAKIFVLSRAMRDDVDLAAAAGADGATIEIIANPVIADGILRWPAGAATEKARTAIAAARDAGLAVNLFFVDATRVPAAMLAEFAAGICERERPDTLTLADTFGVANPRAIATYVRALGEATQVPTYVHCHNEFGLAVANSFAGLEAGAYGVHTSVNGIGERAGNAALEDIVMGAGGPFAFETTVDPTRLRELSRLVASASKIEPVVNKSAVGSQLFTIESGIAATFYEALKDGDLRQFYAYTPASIGGEVEVLLGKGSGAASIRLRLAEIGRQDLEGSVDALVAETKALGGEVLRPLTDEEFLAIVEKVAGAQSVGQ